MLARYSNNSYSLDFTNPTDKHPILLLSNSVRKEK